MSGATFTIPLCLQGFSTVGSRGVAPFPQGMSLNIEQFAGTKPEPSPRWAGILSCRLTHRPIFAQSPRPKAHSLDKIHPGNIRLHPRISVNIRP